MNSELRSFKPIWGANRRPALHGLPPRWTHGAGLLVALSLLTQYGFPLPFGMAQGLHGLDMALALVYSADLLLALVKHHDWREVWIGRRFEYYLLTLTLGLITLVGVLAPTTRRDLLVFLHFISAPALIFSLVKWFLLCLLVLQLLRGMQRIFVQGMRPELILASSFGTLILVGTLLLLLPNACADAAKSISTVDAFFTATSAACVTGLSVRDTGSEFSPFGQMVILVLIQIGGLGIITFVAFLSVFSTRTLPVPQMVVFQQIINAPALSDLKRQIAGILLTTAVIEIAGALVLYYFLPGEGDPFGRIAWSVFHAISAFCNAGFALQPDNLISYQANVGLNLTLMALIILGGLGFLVLPELIRFRFTRARFWRRFGFFRRLHAGQVPVQLSVQSRLSLHVTWWLLVGGFIGFWMLELNHVLREHPLGESALIVAFQAVTPRTAGFNTIPIHELRDATLVFLIMLMVIGANPVSTGGGIKTVNFGVLLLALRAMVLGRARVETFGRTLPVKALFTALSMFVLYILSAGLGIFLLALFDPSLPLRDQVFEVISALSTVGLSTGITAQLSTPSKLALCLLMFIGRVGPISLVLSVFQSRRALDYDLPEEEVVVG